MKTCPECSKPVPDGAASCPACGFPFGAGAATASKGTSGPSGGKCPACGLFNPPTALVCDCGYDFAAHVVRDRRQEGSGAGRPRSSGSGGFFSFKTMVSADLIRFTYVIGMIGLLVAPLVYAVEKTGDAGPVTVVVVLIGTLVAQVLWRLACEGWILLFRIHEVLESIDSKVERR